MTKPTPLKTHFRLLFIIFLLSVALPSTADSADKCFLFILDTSNSMNGYKRLTMSKHLIRESIKHIPPETYIALRVFNQDPDDSADDYFEECCHDSDLLLDFDNHSLANVDSVLRSIVTTGSTPIEKTLEESTNDFFLDDRERTIILITDGGDTCCGDPSARASSFRKHYNITVHVIGLSIKDQDDRKELRGIAENTGGKYINSSDYTELRGELFSLIGIHESQLTVILEDEEDNPANGTIKIFDRHGEIAADSGIQQDEFTATLPDGEYMIKVRTENGSITEKDVTVSGNNPEEIIVSID